MDKRIAKTIKNKNLDRWLVIAGLAFIVVFSSHNFSNLRQIFVLPDEFGYWGNAAALAGNDWSSLLNNISYYSYGFSLLLIPLYKICDSAYLMYQIALWLNVLFLCLSFLLACSCAKKWFPSLGNRVAVVMAFLSVCYPTYMLYVNIGWGEILQVFLFWGAAWCFTSYQKKGKLSYAWLMAIILVYSYLVHQRNLGVLVAGIISMFLVALNDKKQWKKFLCFIVLLAVLFVSGDVFKKYIQQHFYQGNALLATNDYSMQITKLNYLSDSFKGIADIILSLSGKLIYMLTATAGVLIYGIYELGKYSWTTAVKAVRKKRGEKVIFDWIPLFLLLSIGSSWVINSVFFVVPGREDHLYYGRYMEQVFGPVLIYGFMSVYRMNVKVRKILIVSTLACVFGVFLITLNNPFELDGMVSAMIVGIREFIQSGKIDLIGMLVDLTAFGVLSILIFSSRGTPTRSRVIFTAIVLLFWMKNYTLMLEDLNKQQASYYEVAQLADYALDHEEVEKIIYINSSSQDANNNMSNILQYIAYDKEVLAISSDKIKDYQKKNTLFVSYGLTNLDEVNKDEIRILNEGNGYYSFMIR